MGRKAYTKESFNLLIKELTNENYELIGDYINISTKTKFKCPKGHIFEMTPNRFRSGDRCNKCSKNHRYSIKDIKNEFNNIFKDYSILNKEYKDSKTKLEIIHNKCNTKFKMSRDNYLYIKSKCICPKCKSLEKNIKLSKFDNKNYKERFDILHPELILLENYEDTIKNNTNKIKIKCKNCNNISYVNKYWVNRIKNSRTGCPFCLESKGEKIINNYLKNKNILFERQKQFDDLKNKFNLKFDFCIYLKDNSFILLEYDGELHFKPLHGIANSKEKLKKVKENDKLKNNYCKNKNINLIRIKYTEFNNIEKILDKILITYDIKFND